MGSCFTGYAIAMETDKKPKWFKIWHDSPFISDYRKYLQTSMGYSDEELADKSNEDCAEDLNSAIEMVKEAWDGERSDCATYAFSKMRFLIAGGETWGDSPGEVYDAIEILYNCGKLLDEIGFEA